MSDGKKGKEVDVVYTKKGNGEKMSEFTDTEDSTADQKPSSYTDKDEEEKKLFKLLNGNPNAAITGDEDVGKGKKANKFTNHETLRKQNNLKASETEMEHEESFGNAYDNNKQYHREDKDGDIVDQKKVDENEQKFSGKSKYKSL